MVDRLRRAGCVFAEQEAALIDEAGGTDEEVERLVTLRLGGLPLEQVLGWAAFAGHRVAVARGVFVPRRRTELLAELAVARLDREPAPEPVLVDLCCGSGAVGVAVLAARPGTVVHAADLDPDAVACARRNLPGASVHLGDLAAALPTKLRRRVDVLTACAPYVPTDAVALMPPEAREHEPRGALDGGSDGLDVVRRIAAVASGWLRAGGTVLLEVGADQTSAACAALAGVGIDAEVVTDEDRSATVVAGHRPWSRDIGTRACPPDSVLDR